jgi:predicted SnoaL-like aldol condensation-catalyzing enzyme
MKKSISLLLCISLLSCISDQSSINNSGQERNKRIAVKYHEFNPDDVDTLLAANFIGHTNNRIWNRESNLQARDNKGIEDKIVDIVAENDLVAIKFIRKGEFKGESISIDVMQFMRFENAKISEIWEIFDPTQILPQVENK